MSNFGETILKMAKEKDKDIWNHNYDFQRQ